MEGEKAQVFDLDQVINEGMQEFTGQESPMEMTDPGATGTQKEEAESQEGGEAGKLEGKEAEKPKAGEGLEAGKPGGEEAGKGQEAAETEKRIQVLEEENRALKKKESDAVAAEAEGRAEADFEKSVYDYAKDRNRKALSAIDDLDPDQFSSNEAYQDRVAEIWAEKDRDITRHLRILDKKGRAAAVSGASSGTETPVDAGKTDAGGDKSSDSWDSVRSAATAAGLSSEDPEFLVFCQQAPMVDGQGNPIDFQAQIDWAIKETREHKRVRTLVREGKVTTAEDLVRHRQEIEQPMGRAAVIQPGGGPGGRKDVPQPVTLNDALDFSAHQRTL